MHTPATTLLIDERYEYRSYHSDGGVTRLRLDDQLDRSPIMLLPERPENTNASVTNMVASVVAEIGTLLMPHRFNDAEPFTVIEHYPAQPETRVRDLMAERCSQALF